MDVVVLIFVQRHYFRLVVSFYLTIVYVQWNPLYRLWLSLLLKVIAILSQRLVCTIAETVVAVPQYTQLFLNVHIGEIIK